MKRLFHSSIILIIVGVAVVAGVQSPATAAVVGGVACTTPSSQTATYSPPLTNSPQTVELNISRQYGPCVSPSEPAITSGTSSTSTTVTTDCSSLYSAGSFILDIKWNTGEISTLSGNRVATYGLTVITITSTGTVAAGPFTGDTFVHEVVVPAPPVLACAAGMGTVSSVYGTINLVITSV